jgi:hypothetical protein
MIAHRRVTLSLLLYMRHFLVMEDLIKLKVIIHTADGFELVDQGLAELVEPPGLFQKGKSYVELAPETLELLDELVTAGICANPKDAITKAVHSYVIAVLPHSDKLVLSFPIYPSPFAFYLSEIRSPKSSFLL